MSKQAVQHSRRKLLTVLSISAVAGKLPEVWTKPVVASVMLPAHAVGTGPLCNSAQLIVSGTSEPNGSYTINLVGSAFGLPSGTIFYGLFHYYGGSVLAGLTNLYPGIHAATITVTVPNTALCSNLALDVFQQGNLTVRLCSDNTSACTVTNTF